MFKVILHTAENLEFLGLVSLILFFIAFLYVIYFAINLEKKHIDKMSNLPLDDNELSTDK